jgi:hypothetical protein
MFFPFRVRNATDHRGVVAELVIIRHADIFADEHAANLDEQIDVFGLDAFFDVEKGAGLQVCQEQIHAVDKRMK